MADKSDSRNEENLTALLQAQLPLFRARLAASAAAFGQLRHPLPTNRHTEYAIGPLGISHPLHTPAQTAALSLSATAASPVHASVSAPTTPIPQRTGAQSARSARVAAESCRPAQAKLARMASPLEPPVPLLARPSGSSCAAAQSTHSLTEHAAARALADPLAANASALQALALRSAMALYAQSLAVSPLAALVSPLKHSLALTSPEPLDGVHSATVASPVNLSGAPVPPVLSNLFSLHMPFADPNLLSLLADPRFFSALPELRHRTLRASDALGSSGAPQLQNALVSNSEASPPPISNAAITSIIPTPVATPFIEQTASGLPKAGSGIASAPVCANFAPSAPDAADSRSMPCETETGPARADADPERLLADRENVYDAGNERRGLCVLLSNEHFEARTGMPERAGARIDLENLKRVFGQLLGFELWLAQDLSCREILALLHQAARADHTNADCFVCCVLSHGDEGVIYGRDGTLNVDDLIAPFKPNALASTLAGKPKMFFIQACRGTKLDAGVEVADDGAGGRGGDERDGGIMRRIPAEADFLVAYSVVPGYYSWRNSVRGSWFIQALCDVLERYAGGQHPLDLLSMMTRVCRRVAYEFESNVDNAIMSRKKQVPSIVSTLTKDVYFLPKNKPK